MKISSKEITEIAQELESGFKIYINCDTLEFKAIFDYKDTFGDTEIWEEEQEKIEKEWENYIIINKMESWEAFKIMEEFTYEVKDERMQEDLTKILNRKSPFANFKFEIEDSEYREQWFKFRTKKYEDFTKEKLELEEIEFE
ncbi:MAG: hypothetical protein GQ564_15745 [Bacteroidales bacterium]|nr:hypothetical protein [Bacteroidales bacterium]